MSNVRRTNICISNYCCYGDNACTYLFLKLIRLLFVYILLLLMDIVSLLVAIDGN